MGLYRDHIGPWLIERACASPMLDGERAALLSGAEGHVVELGAGAGANFRHYDPERVSRLTAIEPHPALRAKAAPAIAGRGFDIEMVDAVAERLPLDNGCADVVAVTFTLCSIGRLDQALSEARRVLKPSGRLIFLEHGKAQDRASQTIQRLLAPVWKPIALGCHLTRDPLAELTANGFAPEDVDIYRLPGTPAFAATLFRGGARPR